MDEKRQPSVRDDDASVARNPVSASSTLTIRLDDVESEGDATDDALEPRTVHDQPHFPATAQDQSEQSYMKQFRVALPLLVPHQDRKVHLCLAITAFYLAATRLLNVLVPRQMGIVADRLLAGEEPVSSIRLWLVLTLLNSESGLGLIKSFARRPIKDSSRQRITNTIFAHVMSLSMDFHVENDSAEVLKSMNEGGALADVLEKLMVDMLPVCIDVVISVFWFYWKFSFRVSFGLVIASTVYITISVMTARLNGDALRQAIKADREEARVMQQAVQGWQTVSLFDMFTAEEARFAKSVEKSLEAGRKWERSSRYCMAVKESVLPISFFALSCLIFHEISHDRASHGDFVFFTQYWACLIPPLTSLSQHYRWLINDLVHAERILGLLRTKPSIIERKEATDLTEVAGNISFEHVSFSYGPRRPLLRHINASITARETVALVGLSGAGKSTIVKLLLRLYDVTTGKIQIDGKDIRGVTIRSLRAVFGVIPQRPLFFNASIMDNVRYARPSATDDEVLDVCRMASIHDRITKFADGYSTQMGEQGVKLSGGELQRLAIARALLKKAPILVLDEATSAIDAETEIAIQAFLRTIRTQKTTIIIAHRLSTIRDADKILVVNEGQVTESGTHQELLARDGKYRSLWMAQGGKLKEL